ncbi:MAG TPA: nucleotidyltransferase family protein [Candidatus Binatia bacterium]|nr:nucleotidyltransferase family protein [Candidatus Binatia bacterium]
MIVAVVLSAGESSRMGRPKALLPIDGQTFIERIVGALKAGGLERIVIVLGFNAEAIRPQVEPLPVEILINENYQQGQLSSLQTALRRIKDDVNCEAILVHLVDHPYLSAALVRRMIESYAASKKTIIIPKYQGKRGHPVIFDRALFGELLAAPPDQGAKAVVDAHRSEALEIDTDDRGVTLDIDTPELYQRHVQAR